MQSVVDHGEVLAFSLIPANEARGNRMNILRRLAVALAVSLLATGGAVAENQFTKQNSLDDAKLRLMLSDCMTLPLGRIHIKPYSEESKSRYIVALEKAGVVTVKDANTSTGNVWGDLQKNIGKEVGEGDLDIALAPNADKSQIEVRFGSQTCLKTGRTTGNVELVSFDTSEAKAADFTTRKFIVAQGKYDADGAPGSLYSAFASGIGLKLITHGKFRTLYVYDPFKDHWDFRGMDIGDMNEPGFRSNTVEQGLAQFRH
jgi:hypothetical protein